MMKLTFVAAGLLVASIASQAAGQTPEQTAAWQREVDEAKAQHSAGRKMEWAGIGAYVAGAAATISCFERECSGAPVGVGTSLVIGGIVLGLVGSDWEHPAGQRLRLLNAHGAKPPALDAWQREFTAAGHKRSTGVTIGFVGLGIVAAGATLAYHSNCRSYSCTESSSRLDAMILLGGLITTGAGFSRASDANIERAWLTSHQPIGSTALAALAAGHHSVQLGMGRVTSLTYRFSW